MRKGRRKGRRNREGAKEGKKKQKGEEGKKTKKKGRGRVWRREGVCERNLFNYLLIILVLIMNE